MNPCSNLRGSVDHASLNGTASEFVKVNADGKGAHKCATPRLVYDKMLSHMPYLGLLHKMAKAREKISPVAESLEPDNVEVQQSREDFFAPRQFLEYVRTRKRNVVKISKEFLYSQPAQAGRKDIR